MNASPSTCCGDPASALMRLARTLVGKPLDIPRSSTYMFTCTNPVFFDPGNKGTGCAICIDSAADIISSDSVFAPSPPPSPWLSNCALSISFCFASSRPCAPSFAPSTRKCRAQRVEQALHLAFARDDHHALLHRARLVPRHEHVAKRQPIDARRRRSRRRATRARFDRRSRSSSSSPRRVARCRVGRVRASRCAHGAPRRGRASRRDAHGRGARARSLGRRPDATRRARPRVSS